MNKPNLTPQQKAELRKYVEAMNIEANTPLANGSTLTAKRGGGAFSWFLDGAKVSVEEAQKAMLDDPADSWIFTASNGENFEMRRPNAAEQAELNKQNAISAWNAGVQAKKDAKKKAKLAKREIAR